MSRHLSRCKIEPAPDSQFSFRIDGLEVTRWHFSKNAPRPFFYPLVGPSGSCLTRMGHPAAPNHDHHRSLWFAHEDLLGHDFWSEGKPTRILQKQWYAIEDGDDSARLGLCLHWLDGHDPQPLLQQDLVATIRSYSTSSRDGWSLALQSNFLTKAFIQDLACRSGLQSWRIDSINPKLSTLLNRCNRMFNLNFHPGRSMLSICA